MGRELTVDEKRGHTILVIRRIISYVVLILACAICLFPFIILLVNLTKDNASLTSTFNLIPGDHFLANLKGVITDKNKPVFSAMFNSLVVATIVSVGSVYISTLTAYGIYAYNFRLKKAAFALKPTPPSSNLVSWIKRRLLWEDSSKSCFRFSG